MRAWRSLDTCPIVPGMARTLRLAVAQSTVPEDPTDRAALRGSGAEVRGPMREAGAAGARSVQFPEGAITYPSKHVMSSGPPGTLVELAAGAAAMVSAEWALGAVSQGASPYGNQAALVSSLPGTKLAYSSMRVISPWLSKRKYTAACTSPRMPFFVATCTTCCWRTSPGWESWRMMS